MDEIKLKPCPFCGSDDITLWRNLFFGIVGGRCNACGSDSGNKGYGQTKQDAADAWNKRASEKDDLSE